MRHRQSEKHGGGQHQQRHMPCAVVFQRVNAQLHQKYVDRQVNQKIAEIGVIAESVPNPTLSCLQKRWTRISQGPKALLKRFCRPNVIAIEALSVGFGTDSAMTPNRRKAAREHEWSILIEAKVGTLAEELALQAMFWVCLQFLASQPR
jgi:hypothetical protein